MQLSHFLMIIKFCKFGLLKIFWEDAMLAAEVYLMPYQKSLLGHFLQK